MDTMFDYIELFENFLTILNRLGVKTSDVKYFAAYREFLKLRQEGRTYYASLETISDRHGIAIGTMRTKFKLFSKRLTK